MKEITIKCNICTVAKHDMVDKMYGLEFNLDNKFRFVDNLKNADIHICEVCLSRLEQLRTDER